MFAYLFRISLVFPVFAGTWALPCLAAQADPSAEHIIVLYDGSSSMANLPEPDTSQAFITELIHVARISGNPVKIAVILYNGNGVKVLGDEKGMPTAALASLHKKLVQEWEPPAGMTPQDEAYSRCVAMVKAVPNGDVTVIAFGDGRSESGRLRPKEFSQVQLAIDEQIAAIRKRGFPPRTTQQLIDRFLKALDTPGTEEWNRIYLGVQLDAEHELCRRHAAVLKGAKVRFISVDFAGGVEQLREIHKAAGGLDPDYLIVHPADTVIKRLHNLSVTQLKGIVVPRPVSVQQDASSWQRTVHHQLDGVGEAALVTIVFHNPIEDFAKHCELTITAGGAKYIFDVQNSDPYVILSADSSGKVATATLLLPSIPADGNVTVQFRSPGQTMHPPAMTIYTHLRLSSLLAPVFRPQHLPGDRRPMYTLDSNMAAAWIAMIAVKDDPKPIPLGGIEAVLKRRSDGKALRIELEASQQMPSVFRSSKKSRIAPGQYDLEVNYLLESGAQFRRISPLHVQSQHRDEYLAIEIDESSQASDHFAFPGVGDAVRECEIKAFVRTINFDYPITVAFGVVGFADPTGQAPQTVWITPARTQMTLQPGRAYPLILRLKLPDVIEDGLKDGTYTARLQCHRLDLETLMDVRPLRDVPSSTGYAIDDITITLHRPRMTVSIPRGPKNHLQRNGDQAKLTLHVDFGPYRRKVRCIVVHNSSEQRDVQSVFSGFVDEMGRAVPNDEVALYLEEGCNPVQTVKPGERATFVFLLDVAEGVECHGFLRFSGDGLPSQEASVTVEIRDTLLGGIGQSTFYGLGFLLLPLVGQALVRKMRLAPSGSGSDVVLRPGKSREGIAIELGRKGRIRFFIERAYLWWTEMRQGPKPASRQLQFDERTIREDHLVFRGIQEPVQQIRFAEVSFGEDGQPEIIGEVVEAEAIDEQIARQSKKLRWLLLWSAFFTLLGYFFVTVPVLSAAQLVWDVVFH